MPNWVPKSDEKIWQKAKYSVDPDKYDDETYWQVVTSVYKKMGGKFKSAKERLNSLYEKLCNKN